MKRLILVVTTIALISGCGKQLVQNTPADEPGTLTVARASMNQLEGNPDRFRGIYAVGDLTIDLYWGSDSVNKECRQWELLLSRPDGHLLEYRRNLFTEQNAGVADTISQDGNNVRILTRTFGGVDGVRLKVGRGVSVTAAGTMRTCNPNKSHKDVAFSVTRTIRTGAVGSVVRKLDFHHFLASYVY